MISKSHRAENTILRIDNQHVAACGLPPNIDAAGKYVGYYENVHGEQWMLVADRVLKTATLYGGDASWKPIEVAADRPRPGITLNHEECDWLLACLSSAFNMNRAELVAAWNKQSL